MMKKKDGIRKILIVKPSSLGDILHVFPALALLKKHYPDAVLDFLINPEFDTLLDYSPFPVRRRIHFQRKKLAKASSVLPELFKLFRELRQERYDLVVDFQGLLRSSFFAWISAHKRQSLFGFSNPREPAAKLFYDNAVPVNSVHAVQKNVELVNSITERKDPVPDFDIPAMGEIEQSDRPLPEHYLVLFPGARWESKCFPVELFAEIVKRIHAQQKHVHFLIAGSKADISKAEEIRNLLPCNIPVENIAGKTSLNQLFGVIRHADCVISNDSGPMHIAALLKTPVFSFFGSTDPEKTGPWMQLDRVFCIELPCSRCMSRICPRNQIICHKIDPERVAESVLSQIYSKESSC